MIMKWRIQHSKTTIGKNGNKVKIVSNSPNVIVLLDSTFQYSKLNIKSNDAKIIAFDLSTHNDLSNLGITHSLSDDYLKENTRNEEQHRMRKHTFSKRSASI